jgi:CDP-paratose 2-epimerase
MKRLLITGICGFVGSSLARELLKTQEGLVIFGIDNLMRAGSEGNLEPLRDLGCKIEIGDIRFPSDVAKLPAVDWVIDCAANPSVLAGIDGKSSSQDLMDHNLSGTIHLLEFCKRHHAGFLLLSTSRVYSIKELSRIPVVELDSAYSLQFGAETILGLTSEGITEDFSTTPPLSLYGNSKRCSELLALEYGEAFDFPVWINRCGVLAGAGQFGKADQGIFSYWIHSWFERRQLTYIGFGGRGGQVRDCLHPRDLVALLVQQMNEPSRPVKRIQNLSGGLKNSRSLAQLSAWCSQRFGHATIQVESVERAYDLPWMVLDSSLAKEQWGWKPTTPVEDICEEIAQFAELNPHWIR